MWGLSGAYEGLNGRLGMALRSVRSEQIRNGESDMADLDARRRRTKFRAWHRGTREMDLLLGPYTDHIIAEISEPDLALLEALIEVPDQHLFAWVCGREPVPDNYNTGIYVGLLSFLAKNPVAR